MIRRTHRLAPVDVPTAVLLGSFGLNGPDRLHDLIRTARAGRRGAIEEILGGVRRAITTMWPEIVGATLVPVPRHVPGPAHALIMATCEEIARARGWHVAGDALRRTRPASEGKAGGPRDAESEATTLAWSGSVPGTAIILVDDVVRSGATMQACARAVRASGDQRRVLAIALAKVEISEQAT